jgi:hypothetical protein
VADLREFRDELRGLTNLEREAMQDMFTKLRDQHAGTNRFGSAFAAAANALLWSIHDARTEAAETKRAFDRMLIEGGYESDYFGTVSVHDRS